MHNEILIACCVSLVLALALTPVMRILAHRLGLVAQPKTDRWHRQPTALLGGVAVYTTTVSAMLLLGIADDHKAILVSATAMFGVGLLDDIFGLKPGTKLAGQVIAASTLVYLGGWTTWTGSQTADAMLTILWVVAITNAFNLLDNMDGLCAGIAAIAAVAFVWAIAGTDGGAGSLFPAVLAGALLGFLIYNFSPASIFLGDSGSLFIGFAMAGLTVGMEGQRDNQSLISVTAIPVLILLIPIFDTTLVTVARRLAGRAASHGGTDHLSHRLVAIGFSERGAVMILYTLAAMCGGTATLLGAYGFANVNLLIALLLLGFLLLGVYLVRVRVYQDADFKLLKNRAYTPLIVELTYKRRLFEILLDFVLISFAYYGSYRLRFETADFGLQFPRFISSLPVVIACDVSAFWLFGVYRGIWRYVSLSDLTVYVRAVLLGTVMSLVMVAYLYQFEQLSLSVFIIDALLLLFLLVGTRLSFRAIAEFASRQRRPMSRRVLIYGAGDAGVLLRRELLNNDALNYVPVGFLDDDVRKHGQRVHGVDVLGGLEALEQLIAIRDVDAVLLSTANVSRDRIERLQQICHKSATPLVALDIRLGAVTSVQSYDPGAEA